MQPIALSAEERRAALTRLACLHILVIIASNYLVQFPITIFGVGTTLGSFTFPVIFLATDLTVRVFGAGLARRIIFFAMLPALLASCVVSALFHEGVWAGWASLAHLDSVSLRIACASFAGYCCGQLMDITVFNRLRALGAWWQAPFFSSLVGTALDTAVFFSIAFYRSENLFMAEHWVDLAVVDYISKIVICTLFYLPIYGVILNSLARRLSRVRSV